MAAINQIIKGNNKDSSGFKTPELVILNPICKLPLASTYCLGFPIFNNEIQF